MPGAESSGFSIPTDPFPYLGVHAFPVAFFYAIFLKKIICRFWSDPSSPSPLPKKGFYNEVLVADVCHGDVRTCLPSAGDGGPPGGAPPPLRAEYEGAGGGGGRGRPLPLGDVRGPRRPRPAGELRLRRGPRAAVSPPPPLCATPPKHSCATDRRCRGVWQHGGTAH